MHITIRQAAFEEANRITRLINEAFAVEHFFIDGNRIGELQTADLFSSGRIIVAEIDDLIVGCIYMEIRDSIGYLGLLSVDRKYQRRGIAHRLMVVAEDWFRSQACTAVELEIVNLRKELFGYYQIVGYHEFGAAAFPAEAKPRLPCHLVRMHKEL